MKHRLKRFLEAPAAPYLMAGALVLLALVLHFWHGAKTVDVVVSTKSLRFRLIAAPGKSKEMLRAMDCSLLGVHGFEFFSAPMAQASWPARCENVISGERTRMLEPATLRLAPLDEAEAQLHFPCSAMKIAALRVSSETEIDLRLSDSETQNQITLTMHGGRPQLQLQMLSDTIQIHSQDSYAEALQAGQAIPIVMDDANGLRFLPAQGQNSSTLEIGSKDAVLFYELEQWRPASNDLLNVKDSLAVTHVGFESLVNPGLREHATTSAICVQLHIEDCPSEEWLQWQGLPIHIRQDDLRGFVLRSVRAVEPGRLQVALRGNTASFHAGLSKTSDNLICNALSTMNARLGLLLALLLWIAELFYRLKGGKHV